MTSFLSNNCQLGEAIFFIIDSMLQCRFKNCYVWCMQVIKLVILFIQINYAWLSNRYGKFLIDGATYCLHSIKFSFSVYVQTPVEFCVKYHNKKFISRRFEEESCPVFCASYYRPVCGANSFRSYIYRSFVNQCFMDMLNCRGNDDVDCKTCFYMIFLCMSLTKSILCFFFKTG